MRILLDYRPALRERTGVGEYAHQMAAALMRRAGTQDRLTLFSSSWRDRLAPQPVPGATTLDRRVPVALLNFAWHRLGWPPVERLGAEADVVWAMHPLLIPSGRAAQVITIHDLFFLDHPDATAREVRRDYAALAPSHARRADAVIAVSEYTKQRVVSRLGGEPDRIAVCPNGAPAWQPRTEPAPGGPIVHVGTVSARKNVPALVDAYISLCRHRPGTPPLILAGRVEPGARPGSHDDPLARERISLPGYVSDTERMRLYREASMLVMPSLDEGFGLPALEAMTLGIPVVASARGALPEVIGDAGLLVDETDPARFRSGLANAMERLLIDADLRHELRGRGIARSKAFNWDVSAATARQALAAAVERRKTRS